MDLEPYPRRVLEGEASTTRCSWPRIYRSQITLHGRSQPALRTDRHKCRSGARLPTRPSRRSGGPRSCTTSARPPYQTPLGQTRLAHPRRVRSRRAAPMLTEQMLRRSCRVGGVELRCVGAPREERWIRLPQARARRRGRSRRGGACRDRGVRRHDHGASRPPGILRRGCRGRAASAGVDRCARAARDSRGARRGGSRRAGSAAGSSREASRWTVASRSGRATARREGTDDARDRRATLHLDQDGRSPHSARVHEDRCVDEARRPRCGRCRTRSCRSAGLQALATDRRMGFNPILRPNRSARLHASPILRGRIPRRGRDLHCQPTSLVAQQAPRAAAPPSIDERTAGMQKIDGYFPLYWDERTGIAVPRDPALRHRVPVSPPASPPASARTTSASIAAAAAAARIVLVPARRPARAAGAAEPVVPLEQREPARAQVGRGLVREVDAVGLHRRRGKQRPRAGRRHRFPPARRDTAPAARCGPAPIASTARAARSTCRAPRRSRRTPRSK